MCVVCVVCGVCMSVECDGKRFRDALVSVTLSDECVCKTLRVCVSVDGGWSSWTPWSVCSVTCGAGLQSHYRFCSDPERAGNGLPCVGPDREDRVCASAPCSRE